MIHPGLVSVTFRQLQPREIAALAAECGLRGIEWGGDIHVPPGHLDRAREVRRITIEAGLQPAAYGSYYVAGKSDNFDAVLETALALEAPSVRVWAGDQAAASADAAYRRKVADDLNRVSRLAEAAGVFVAIEFHVNTLADFNDTALELLETVPPPLCLNWQPPVGQAPDYVAEGLGNMLPRIGNVHVFHRWPQAGQRRLLSDGRDCWQRYLGLAAQAQTDRWALLEFAQNDDPLALRKDAATLLHLLESVQ